VTQNIDMEFHYRTLTKTISWRIIAFIVTFGVATNIHPTGDFILIASINANLVKTIFYYLHERIWLLTKWGTFRKHKKQFETAIRSFAKTVTWKLSATIITVLVIFIYSKDWSFALNAGILINLVKAVLYYLHERIWNTYLWGKH
tara:strand:+ start:79 stop:513 length:435 start_codon:yes stop_codon:yes gene_type:complete